MRRWGPYTQGGQEDFLLLIDAMDDEYITWKLERLNQKAEKKVEDQDG